MSEFGEGYALGQNSNNNDGFGNGGWLWILVIFALLGFGNGGFGNGGSNMGYDLGKVATTNDVASGFSTSAIMSNQRDLQLGQANIQQTLCQGFSGMNASVANLGYQLSNCCCGIERAIDNVNYNMAKNTCDIIQNQNATMQRWIDIYHADKFDALRLENQTLRFQASQNAQNQFITQVGSDIVNRLQPQPIPSYNVPNPYANYNYNCNNGFGNCCGFN